MNRIKKYFYDWKLSEPNGGKGYYVLNGEKIKIVASIISLIILLVSFYFGTTVILNDEQLNKEISGLYGIGIIIIIVIISLLLTSVINWIINKILKQWLGKEVKTVAGITTPE